MQTIEEKKSEAALVGCAALIVMLFAVSPLLVMLAWNLGVVGVAAATDGSIAGINYWTALGISALYLLIRGMLKVRT